MKEKEVPYSILENETIKRLTFDYVQEKVGEDITLYNDVLNAFILNVYLKKYYNSTYIFEGDRIKISSIHIWDLIGNLSVAKYIENDDFKKLKIVYYYIGQSFGKRGNRNVSDRIGGGHEKLQSLISTKPNNKEVVILFLV